MLESVGTGLARGSLTYAATLSVVSYHNTMDRPKQSEPSLGSFVLVRYRIEANTIVDMTISLCPINKYARLSAIDGPRLRIWRLPPSYDQS